VKLLDSASLVPIQYGKKIFWGDLEEEEEEEKEEEQLDEEELEGNVHSVDSLSSTPTGVETPDVVDLRKQLRKPKRLLYQVFKEKQERVVAGTLLETTKSFNANN
jgi:splicing factor 3B subunit 2